MRDEEAKKKGLVFYRSVEQERTKVEKEERKTKEQWPLEE